ncbi:MAG: hypothetical protein KIT34_04225 [Cyanobacteria bacterium TGS_CYA1]|nr:hypothetical protein [Cyanobacteria bacterium TGS_CYA1]
MKSHFSANISQKQPLAVSLISRAIDTGRLANAYLLTGSNHEDKVELALEIACVLNCLNTESDTKSQNGTFCLISHGPDTVSYCQNCRLISQERHPQAYLQLLSLDPTKPNSKIPVEKARELAFELSKTSPFFRVIWIANAAQDIFHRPAANSLLKTIEEPKNRCIFLLAARSKELVLPTITSRSQEIPLVQKQASMVLSNQGNLPYQSESYQKWSKMPFFQWAKKRHPHSFETARQEALEVSNLLYNAMTKPDDDQDEDIDPLNQLITLELSIIGSSAVGDPYLSQYLSDLLKLSQSLRTRLQRHVSQKASLDNFFIEWLNLRTQVSGILA